MEHALPPTDATDLPSFPRLRGVREVAARTGVNESWWRRQIRRRAVRVHRLGDRVLLADADVAAFLAASAVPPLPPWRDHHLPAAPEAAE